MMSLLGGLGAARRGVRGRHVCALAVAALAIVVGGCTTVGTDDHRAVITGVIVEVEGGLAGVAGFTLLAEDGSIKVIVPGPEATFEGGPLSHVRDHLVSGIPVVVEYTSAEDGTIVASYVEDAQHGH